MTRIQRHELPHERPTLERLIRLISFHLVKGAMSLFLFDCTSDSGNVS